jgi:hypothetical protein
VDGAETPLETPGTAVPEAEGDVGISDVNG